MSLIIKTEKPSDSVPVVPAAQVPADDGRTYVSETDSGTHTTPTSLMASSASALSDASASSTPLTAASSIDVSQSSSSDGNAPLPSMSTSPTFRRPGPLVLPRQVSMDLTHLEPIPITNSPSSAFHKEAIGAMDRPKEAHEHSSPISRSESAFKRVLHPSSHELERVLSLSTTPSHADASKLSPSSHGVAPSPRARFSSYERGRDNWKLSPSSAGSVSPITRPSSSSTTSRPPSPAPATPRTPSGTPFAFQDIDQFYGQYFSAPTEYENLYHPFQAKDAADRDRIAYERFRKLIDMESNDYRTGKKILLYPGKEKYDAHIKEMENAGKPGYLRKESLLKEDDDIDFSRPRSSTPQPSSSSRPPIPKPQLIRSSTPQPWASSRPSSNSQPPRPRSSTLLPYEAPGAVLSEKDDTDFRPRSLTGMFSPISPSSNSSSSGGSKAPSPSSINVSPTAASIADAAPHGFAAHSKQKRATRMINPEAVALAQQILASKRADSDDEE